MIDLSVVFGALIALLLAVMMFKVWPMVKAFLPPAVLAVIQWAARAVVDGVESNCRGKDGAEKRRAAFERIERALEPLLKYMKAHGYTVTPERIYEAIEAAWRQLNTEQLLTGEKKLAPDPGTDEEQDGEPEEE
ncbi:MAG: hypothetical protein IKJ11_11060 [Clostridia bacterium]|nr:hypothetical protein [Clostridia bacterium]